VSSGLGSRHLRSISRITLPKYVLNLRVHRPAPVRAIRLPEPLLQTAPVNHPSQLHQGVVQVHQLRQLDPDNSFCFPLIGDSLGFIVLFFCKILEDFVAKPCNSYSTYPPFYQEKTTRKTIFQKRLSKIVTELRYIASITGPGRVFKEDVLFYIGERIKIIRKGTHQTQQEMASTLGVSLGYISSLESGAAPSDQFIKSFCRAYNILESWLRTGSGPLINAPTRTWEEIVETQPIRKDPIYEGLRLLFEGYSEALRRMFNTLSI